ncbi:MAG: hypothetical protein NTY16_02630 [Deltaproteobacteria bacterium]|nr:hypothetical protein [Deltaproteobacteria bacterium]
MIPEKRKGVFTRNETMKDVMPILLIGPGSPMNVVQENEFTSSLKNIAAHIPRPQAIVVISAHWLTEGTLSG